MSLVKRNIIRYDKKGRRLPPPFMRPLNLLDAVEFTADGTSRDEALRHFADELLKVGFVRGNQLFIQSYDIATDSEIFLPVGERKGFVFRS